MYLDGLLIMRKNALTVTLAALVAGVFGAFVRWLQNMNAFEEDTGLQIIGAKTGILMVVYLIAAAALFALAAGYVQKRMRAPEGGRALFFAKTRTPCVLAKLLSAVTAVGSVLLIVQAGDFEYPSAPRILGICGLACSAVCAVGYYTAPDRPVMRPWVSLAPVLFGCVWLIVSYKNNAEDPVVWHYVIEILALCAAIMGRYELAALFYRKNAKSAYAMLFSALAVMLCVTALADSRPMCMQLLFAAEAAWQATTLFVMAENLLPAEKNQ